MKGTRKKIQMAFFLVLSCVFIGTTEILGSEIVWAEEREAEDSKNEPSAPESEKNDLLNEIFDKEITNGEEEKVTLDYQFFIDILQDKAPSGGREDDSNESVKEDGVDEENVFPSSAQDSEQAKEELIRQPKMLLENCSLWGKELEAGSQQQMVITFKNQSTSQTMYNLKVTATTESSALQLTQNSFYFAEVAPGGIIKMEQELQVALDAANGPVPINFDFEYEDKKGTFATGKESITLSVLQPVRMELEVSDIPEFLYASDTLELDLKALNLSRTSVYNVCIRLCGTGLFPNNSVFVGNMEAGTEGGGTMNVYVGTRTMEAVGEERGESDGEKYGPVSGTITLQYEDAKGEMYEISKDFETEIKKAQIMALEVSQEEETNSWWVSVFLVIVVGLALAVLLLIFRLCKKNVLLEEARRQ
ncbi:MAG: hypothetical protein K2M46_01535 [Lachnospiraceae bacterium]|nr:hypothetical protein [Lachnospiraceae bacterium]